MIKEWCDVARYFSPVITLSWRHMIGMPWKTRQCKQRKQSDHLMVIHSYYVSGHGYILISNEIVSIFPVTIRSTFLKIKRCRMIVETLKVTPQWRDFEEWMATNNMTSCPWLSLPLSIVIPKSSYTPDTLVMWSSFSDTSTSFVKQALAEIRRKEREITPYRNLVWN